MNEFEGHSARRESEYARNLAKAPCAELSDKVPEVYADLTACLAADLGGLVKLCVKEPTLTAVTSGTGCELQHASSRCTDHSDASIGKCVK